MVLEAIACYKRHLKVLFMPGLLELFNEKCT